MAALRSYVMAFVLGFGSCAALARLLLPTPASATSPLTFGSTTPAQVVDEVGNSVVNIEVYPDDPEDSNPLSRLFSNAADESGPNAVASGVIISPKGYIVTNEHVIADGGRIRARLADGREFDARITGRDEDTDLAVLKIDADHLTSAELGDSQNLHAGDSVVAIGNPLGFENSVSVGVVSANRRGPFRVDGRTLGDMIQTDAAINQGNSGGGLFDARGRLIGINTAIMVTRGGSGSIGIGFAVPSHRVRPVTHALMDGGRVPRPWLGITYQPPSVGSLVRRIRHGIGVMVEDVVPGSPAARAGLRPADIVRTLGSCKIHSPDDLYNFVSEYHPGQTVTAHVLRGGHEQTVRLKLSEKPSSLLAQ